MFQKILIYEFFCFTVEVDTLSQRTYRSSLSVNEGITVSNRDFKLLVESKSNVRHCVHLVAPTVQDKEAWMSDISQCIDNIHLHTMLSPTNDRASIGGWYTPSSWLLQKFDKLIFRSSSIGAFGSTIIYR